MKPELIALSRQLSRVLRHKPEMWRLKLDLEGWVDVQRLLAGAVENGVALSVETLNEIVAQNDKSRFKLSPDGSRIRAVQGHSVPVDLKLKPALPPSVLFHGTIRKFVGLILREGIRPMGRHAVHLSSTRDAAIAVGSRRGGPIVLVVNSGEMHRDGILFYRSENNIWLTSQVPARYLG